MSMTRIHKHIIIIIKDSFSSTDISPFFSKTNFSISHLISETDWVWLTGMQIFLKLFLIFRQWCSDVFNLKVVRINNDKLIFQSVSNNVCIFYIYVYRYALPTTCTYLFTYQKEGGKTWSDFILSADSAEKKATERWMEIFIIRSSPFLHYVCG